MTLYFRQPKLSEDGLINYEWCCWNVNKCLCIKW